MGSRKLILHGSKSPHGTDHFDSLALACRTVSANAYIKNPVKDTVGHVSWVDLE